MRRMFWMIALVGATTGFLLIFQPKPERHPVPLRPASIVLAKTEEFSPPKDDFKVILWDYRVTHRDKESAALLHGMSEKKVESHDVMFHNRDNLALGVRIKPLQGKLPLLTYHYNNEPVAEAESRPGGIWVIYLPTVASIRTLYVGSSSQTFLVNIRELSNDTVVMVQDGRSQVLRAQMVLHWQ